MVERRDLLTLSLALAALLFLLVQLSGAGWRMFMPENDLVVGGGWEAELWWHPEEPLAPLEVSLLVCQLKVTVQAEGSLLTDQDKGSPERVCY